MSGSLNIYDVIIVGAGPAGTSAAIHLALSGARVLLAEQKKFPRPKLCGEFISPECLDHFERLGVADRMLTAGGARLTRTVFYSRGGHSVDVPSEWFSGTGGALGLSRAEMDHLLLDQARSVGVEVFEGTQASGLIANGQGVRGVRLKSDNGEHDCQAGVTIDATGRKRALARRLDHGQQNGAKKKSARAPFVAFKAHLENSRADEGACEIYFYRGGYGGLSSVEGGRSNLCFIASADDVRRCGADAESVMRGVVSQNSRAAYTLGRARACTEWLGVSLDSFGRRELIPARGLLAIGDAAAFIDPFTGSGMLMALESGEVAAAAITRHLIELKQKDSFAGLAREYTAAYRERFDRRLRVCAILRRAAFVPGIAEAAILFFGASSRVRRSLARATRKGF